jgi:UDP-glucose:(heptosyl)LPS alpha-1,3-glucosyltransferase
LDDDSKPATGLRAGIEGDGGNLMNVALVIERVETWRGGAETSTIQFANHLAQQGCTVTVLTMTNVPSTPAMTIVPIPAGPGFRPSRSGLFARRVAAYVQEQNFDIVHSITPCLAADVYQPRGGTVPEILARNLAMRPSVARRGLKWLGQRLDLKYRVVGNLERRLLRRRPPPWVIAISQYVADQLKQHYDFDSSRVRVIFNGVDPDLSPSEERQAHRVEVRRQFGLADNDLVLLAVAHNFKLKGVDAIVQALAHPRTRKLGNVYAVIVGRGNPSPFVRLASRLGVADRVLFAGPSQRVNAFFHAADVLVHPTYYDPCSRVVLEAMTAGLPVITTRFNGAAERITDGREGYVIASPTDTESLADRICRLADSDHRRECARLAPLAVEAASMSRHAAEVVRLYEDIIRDGQVRRGRYR